MIWIRLSMGATQALVKCLELTDQVAQRLPLVSKARALALDTFLGPEDDFDYVSRTTSVHS